MFDFLLAYWFVPVILLVGLAVYFKFLKKPKRLTYTYSDAVVKGVEEEKKAKKEKSEKEKKAKKAKK